MKKKRSRQSLNVKPQIVGAIFLHTLCRLREFVVFAFFCLNDHNLSSVSFSMKWCDIFEEIWQKRRRPSPVSQIFCLPTAALPALLVNAPHFSAVPFKTSLNTPRPPADWCCNTSKGSTKFVETSCLATTHAQSGLGSFSSALKSTSLESTLLSRMGSTLLMWLGSIQY